MPLPNIYLADYDLNKPNYNSYSGAAVKVKDASGSLFDIGFDGSGKPNKTVADAIGSNLQAQWIYDKTGNGRDAKIVPGSGDWLLKWDSRGIAYLEAQTINARFETDNPVTVAAPKIFSVAYTRNDEVNAYLVDFGGNQFAVDGGSKSIYDATYVPKVANYAFNGSHVYAPDYDSNSILLYTNESAYGLHQRAVFFGAGNDYWLIDGVAYPATANAGDTSRTAKITIGNHASGGYGGKQRFYDLKIVEGSISNTDRDASVSYQNSTFQILQENVLIIDGDSLGFGFAPDSYYNAPIVGNLAALCQNMLGREKWVVINRAVTGFKTSQLLNPVRLAVNFAHFRPGKQNKLILNGCFNDFFYDEPIGITKSNLQNLISQYQTVGFEVALRTAPRSTLNGENWKGYDSYRANLNSWMFAGTSGADFIIDETGNPYIGTGADTNNTVYFYQNRAPVSPSTDDHIHGKSPYYQEVLNESLEFIPPPAPIPDFTVSGAEAGEPISLTNSTSGIVDSYSIEWGDGAVSTDINATHRYKKSGVFNITLTATNVGGSASVTRQVTIAEDLLPFEGAELLTRIDRITQSNGSALPSLTDLSGNNRNLASSGGWTFQTAVANGKPVIRGGGSTNAPLINSSTFSIRCGWMVAKFAGSTFDTFRGLLTDLASKSILVGKNADDTFVDFGYDLYEFRANDRIYPAQDALAPLNAFKIIFFKFWKNLTLNGVSLGQDKSDTSRRWNGDIAAFGLYSRDFCESDIRSYSQKLAAFYGLTLADVIPFQGMRRDATVYGERDANVYDPPEGQRIVEFIGEEKQSFNLTFEYRHDSEFKEMRTFHQNHYLTPSCIYRDYNVIPPEDIEGYINSPLTKSGAINNISYAFTFKEK